MRRLSGVASVTVASALLGGVASAAGLGPDIFDGKPVPKPRLKDVSFMALIVGAEKRCGAVWVDLPDLGSGLLTAAHCEPVCAHRVHLITSSGKPEKEGLEIKQIYRSNCYDKEILGCDLAFVRTREDAPPAGRLARRAESPPTAPRTLEVYGWGGNASMFSKVLEFAPVPLNPLDRCADPRRTAGNAPTRDGKICAGKEGTGLADGDSGGALLQADDKALIGIASSDSFIDGKPRGFDLFMDVTTSSRIVDTLTLFRNCD